VSTTSSSDLAAATAQVPVFKTNRSDTSQRGTRVQDQEQDQGTGGESSAKLNLVAYDSKPVFADNSAQLRPEHCVLLAPPK